MQVVAHSAPQTPKWLPMREDGYGDVSRTVSIGTHGGKADGGRDEVLLMM